MGDETSVTVCEPAEGDDDDEALSLARRLKLELTRSSEDRQRDLFGELLEQADVGVPKGSKGGRPVGSRNRRQPALVRLVEIEQWQGRSLLHVMAAAARIHSRPGEGDGDNPEDFAAVLEAAKLLGCKPVEVLGIKAGLLKSMAPYALQALGTVSSDAMDAFIALMLAGKASEAPEAMRVVGESSESLLASPAATENPDFPDG